MYNGQYSQQPQYSAYGNSYGSSSSSDYSVGSYGAQPQYSQQGPFVPQYDQQQSMMMPQQLALPGNYYAQPTLYQSDPYGYQYDPQQYAQQQSFQQQSFLPQGQAADDWFDNAASQFSETGMIQQPQPYAYIPVAPPVDIVELGVEPTVFYRKVDQEGQYHYVDQKGLVLDPNTFEVIGPVVDDVGGYTDEYGIYYPPQNQGGYMVPAPGAPIKAVSRLATQQPQQSTFMDRDGQITTVLTPSLPIDYSDSIIDVRTDCAYLLSLYFTQVIRRPFEVAPTHLLIISEKTSPATVRYNRMTFVVDSLSRSVHEGLPADYNRVGRPVIPRGALELHSVEHENKPGKMRLQLTDRSRIVMDHILNASSDDYEIKDSYIGETRLALMHYRLEKGVPKKGGYHIRAIVVDLDAGVPVANSYGYTPVAIAQKIEAIKGVIRITSTNEFNQTVVNKFYTRDFGRDTEVQVLDESRPKNVITMMPFFEGVLLRVFLYNGVMYVVSHSKLDLRKSTWNGSDSFRALFDSFNLTKEALFGQDAQYSSFHFNFMLMATPFLHASRVRLDQPALVYLGVMYNFSTSNDYNPFPNAVVAVEPAFGSDPFDILSLNNTSRATVINGFPFHVKQRAVYIPTVFGGPNNDYKIAIEQANSHLQKEFDSPFPNCDGSVIIMEKDASGFITNLVRVVTGSTRRRLQLTNTGDLYEDFLALVPDSYPNVPNDVFFQRYKSYQLPPISLLNEFAEGKNNRQDNIRGPIDFYLKIVAPKIDGNREFLFEDELNKLNKVLVEPLDPSKRNKNYRLAIISLNYALAVPLQQQKTLPEFLPWYYQFINRAATTFVEREAFIASNSDKLVKLVKLINYFKFDSASKSKKSTKRPTKKPVKPLTPATEKANKIKAFVEALSKAESGTLINAYRGLKKIDKLDKFAAKKAAN